MMLLSSQQHKRSPRASPIPEAMRRRLFPAQFKPTSLLLFQLWNMSPITISGFDSWPLPLLDPVRKPQPLEQNTRCSASRQPERSLTMWI